MSELIFLVEEASEGGYIARSLEHPIFTEADTMESLKDMIRDAVICHFEKDKLPKMIRLHYVKDEVFALDV